MDSSADTFADMLARTKFNMRVVIKTFRTVSSIIGGSEFGHGKVNEERAVLQIQSKGSNYLFPFFTFCFVSLVSSVQVTLKSNITFNHSALPDSSNAKFFVNY